MYIGKFWYKNTKGPVKLSFSSKDKEEIQVFQNSVLVFFFTLI